MAIPLAILTAIAQSTVAPYIRFFGVSPDFSLLFTLSWVLLQGLDEGIIVSLVAGFALDALSSAPFGLSMVSLALTSGLAGVAEVNIFRSARFLPFIMVCLATPLYYAFYLGAMQLLGGASFHISIVWRVVLPATAINLILMPFVYRLVKVLCAHTRPAQVEWQ